MKGSTAGNESVDVDVVNCSDSVSTVSITIVPELSLDDADQVDPTSNDNSSMQNEVTNNDKTGSLVSLDNPVSETDSQDHVHPMIDVPVKKENGKLVMLRVSLNSFSKIPVQEIISFKPDETTGYRLPDLASWSWGFFYSLTKLGISL